MATQHNHNQERVARWERKKRQGAREREARAVLRERKQQRKLDRGVEQILRHAPNNQTGRHYVAAVQRLWAVARPLKIVVGEHLSRPGYVGRDNPYLYALAQLADRHTLWGRDPADFRPRSHNTGRQFTELVRHLFAMYPPPGFVEQAWFIRDRRKARRQQAWYIQLGQGESPRRLSGLPIELTRRAAHVFSDVPDTLTIEQGLRWAQVRAMGADPPLIDALLATPLATDFARDAFWLTVVRFLIEQPLFDRNHVGPIVDYIHHQRHVPQLAAADGLDGPARPAQPSFSMRGRTLGRLLRQVHQWHGGLARQAARTPYCRWTPSGIPGMSRVEGQGRSEKQVVIRELLDSAGLAHEGRRMHHCVGSYVASCRGGQTAIFTMTSIAGAAFNQLLTIEVRVPTRTIVQARGKCNAPATTEDLRLLRAWAQLARLQIASWL